MDNLFSLNSTDLQKVAALYCEGMGKEDIAHILSKDENAVQRMLEASENKYFCYKPILTSKVLTPEIQELVYNETLCSCLSDILKEKLELALIPITITPSPLSMFNTFEIGAKEDSQQLTKYAEAEWHSVKIVCRRAAQELSQILFDGEDHTVGLNWGMTVKETVEYIRPLSSQLEGTISVISLFGDLGFYSPEHEKPFLQSSQVNCNNLVTLLTQRLGGHGEAFPLNVPGFIPEQFSRSKETFDAIRSFMTSHYSYRRIFGAPSVDEPRRPRNISGIVDHETDAKISSMDTIITSLGSVDNYTLLHEYFKAWLSNDELDRLIQYSTLGKIVGDIGGHFIASPDGKNDDELINFLTQLNNRILAAQPSDFIDVASRHLKNNKGAGVVGITAGARKAKILYTLLSWNPCAISRLIMDSHCALALFYLIDRQEFNGFIETEEGKQLVKGKEKWSNGTRQLIPV